MYTPSHIANFMLERAEREDRRLSPMKLLKLVYIGYGWNLAIGEKLFDEAIRAWPHGPVVRSLYHEFKHYGKTGIRELSVNFDLDSGDISVPRVPKGDEKANVILGKVWGVYRHFSGWDLRDKTHEPDTPWSQIYNKHGQDAAIPDDLIAEHFTRKIGEYLRNARGQAAA